jgi:hypothetical protein
MTAGVVSAGRVVHIGVGVETHIAQPGEQIELPLSEIQRLRKLGFLVDDTKPA